MMERERGPSRAGIGKPKKERLAVRAWGHGHGEADGGVSGGSGHREVGVGPWGGRRLEWVEGRVGGEEVVRPEQMPPLRLLPGRLRGGWGQGRVPVFFGVGDTGPLLTLMGRSPWGGRGQRQKKKRRKMIDKGP